MTLFIVGLGLGDERDITVRGLEAVKSCDLIFLEMYTSILGVDKEKLESFYGKKIIVADRDMVETEAEERICRPAQKQNVAFLVVGDPVCATTHTDLWLRAKNEYECDVELIHNASIMGAAGSSGLQLYNFGHTVSIPFFEEKWRPTSFYPKLHRNRQQGMHTLCLLDIKVKEPDFHAMVRGGAGAGAGRIRYLPPRFMTIQQCCRQLLEAERRHQQKAYRPERTLCVGLARLGQPTQKIRAGTLLELSKLGGENEHDENDENGGFGGPLHSLIVCGDLHDLELEVLKSYMIDGSTYDPKNDARIADPVYPDSWNPDGTEAADGDGDDEDEDDNAKGNANSEQQEES